MRGVSCPIPWYLSVFDSTSSQHPHRGFVGANPTGLACSGAARLVWLPPARCCQSCCCSSRPLLRLPAGAKREGQASPRTPAPRLLLELEPRVRDVWSCGCLEPGFAPVVLGNHVCPWPRRDLQSHEQGFGGVCSADSIAVHSSISFVLKQKEKEEELTGNIGNKESCLSAEKPCTQCDF